MPRKTPAKTTKITEFLSAPILVVVKHIKTPKPKKRRPKKDDSFIYWADESEIGPRRKAV